MGRRSWSSARTPSGTPPETHTRTSRQSGRVTAKPANRAHPRDTRWAGQPRGSTHDEDRSTMNHRTRLTCVAACLVTFATGAAPAVGAQPSDPADLVPLPPPGSTCQQVGTGTICRTVFDASVENEPAFVDLRPVLNGVGLDQPRDVNTQESRRPSRMPWSPAASLSSTSDDRRRAASPLPRSRELVQQVPLFRHTATTATSGCLTPVGSGAPRRRRRLIGHFGHPPRGQASPPGPATGCSLMPMAVRSRPGSQGPRHCRGVPSVASCGTRHRDGP